MREDYTKRMKKVSDKKRLFCGFIADAPPFSGEKADKKRSGYRRVK